MFKICNKKESFFRLTKSTGHRKSSSSSSPPQDTQKVAVRVNSWDPKVAYQTRTSAQQFLRTRYSKYILIVLIHSTDIFNQIYWS